MNKEITKYYLPDGSNIDIGDEKIKAPELLFNPELIGKEYLSFDEMVINSINKADIDLRNQSYENIWISGGNSSFKELNKRLVQEIKNKVDKNLKVNVLENEKIKPQHRCWVGGNVISILEIFKKMWVTRSEWNEKGSGIIHIKTI